MIHTVCSYASSLQWSHMSCPIVYETFLYGQERRSVWIELLICYNTELRVMVKKTRRQRIPNCDRNWSTLEQVKQFFVDCEALHPSISNGQIQVTWIDRESSRTDNKGIRCPGVLRAELRYSSKWRRDQSIMHVLGTDRVRVQVNWQSRVRVPDPESLFDDGDQPRWMKKNKKKHEQREVVKARKVCQWVCHRSTLMSSTRWWGRWVKSRRQKQTTSRPDMSSAACHACLAASKHDIKQAYRQ